MSSTPPGQPQAAVVSWATSMCQALRPALAQLGSPPQPDLNNSATTRQAYINYLGNARNATQQATDRLSSIGPPPVANGPQILGQMTTQLNQLRDSLNDTLTQPECQNLATVNGTSSTTSPTESPAPTR
jgi:hypothetical protein